ncbi:MAG: hypothetical protein FWD82_06670 [Defluviitaleaceae bacterium]|nr:hypothetical protein [Defluviitaleaceae bacterium]
MELAYEYGKLDTDNIRQCYMFISRPEHHPTPLTLSSEATLSNYSPNLSVYDVLYSGHMEMNEQSTIKEMSAAQDQTVATLGGVR